MSPGRVWRSRWSVGSPCGRYRWLLGRTWDPRRPTLAVVALNPSTADGQRDDPTLRRVIRFAQDHGFGRVRVANLYAWRATDPTELAGVEDPVGPGNDRWIQAAVEGSDAALAAWGNGGLGTRHGAWRDAVPWVILGTTARGAPRHPLYVRASTPLRPWTRPRRHA